MRLPLILAILASMFAPVNATTIAYDGVMLAADSQSSTTSSKRLDAKKIERCGDAFVACAGATDQGTIFRQWYRAGHDMDHYPAKLDDFIALVVTPLGAFVYWDKPVGVPVQAPYAIGSGEKAALGAMRAGATAQHAVEIAELIDLFTGGPVITHCLDELK